MIGNKTKLLIVDLLLMFLLIAADQITKFLAVVNLRNQEPFVLWEGVFELQYLENSGAAFGMLQGKKSFFVLTSIIFLIVIVYVLVRVPNQKKYTKLHITLAFIASGAIGNLIDRIRYDYVIDFLYFSLINFPIFNVADIYVTLSSIVLAALLLFVYTESDLEFLFIRSEKS
ncbi:lipoprotein signal peptidase [Lachnospiraceae bacterium]|nr:lipoprotein signal peptidase [Lachnospiraceae bacterium]